MKTLNNSYVDLRIKRAIEEGDDNIRLSPMDCIMAVMDCYDVEVVVDYNIDPGMFQVYENCIRVKVGKGEDE